MNLSALCILIGYKISKKTVCHQCARLNGLKPKRENQNIVVHLVELKNTTLVCDYCQEPLWWKVLVKLILEK